MILDKGKPAAWVSWWQVQHVPFGEPPFDDVTELNPLRGRLASSVPENELMHAAALCLFPELDRLWIAANEHGSNMPSLAQYVESCRRRIGRLLLQYLRLRRLAEGANDFDEADEALDLTTLAFIHVVGVFDVLALFVRDVLNLTTKDRDVAWQNDKFRADVARVSPALASLMEPGSQGGRTFAAIRALRNTVHKAMPRPALLALNSEDDWNKACIVLAGSLHALTVAALDDAGWSRFVFNERKHPEWLRDATDVEVAGVTRVGDMLIVEPAHLVLMCLNEGVPLINDLLAAIPIAAPRIVSPRLEDPASLHPQSLRLFAVEMLGLVHLADTSGRGAVPKDSP